MKLPSNVTRFAGKMYQKLKKSSPEICMILGIGGVIAGGVMACIATTKVDPIVDKFNDDLDRIHEDKDRSDEIRDDRPDMEYPIVEYRKHVVAAYTGFAADVVKLYGPSILMSAVGIGLICKSHFTMKERVSSLAAAYTALNKSFKEYRQTVIDTYGQEADNDIRFGKPVKEVISMNEDGLEVTKEKTTYSIDGDIDPFEGILIGPGDHGIYESNPFYTLDNVKIIERTAQDQLERWGFLSINDMLKIFNRKPVAYVKGSKINLSDYGWVYDPKNPATSGRIDFGLFTVNRSKTIDFQNGEEDFLLIDFNIDGHIPSIMEMKK